MEEKKINRNLSSLFFAVYWVFACYTPFLLLYLQDRGLSYIQIGSIFALNSAINVIFQPLWGYLTDKYISIKKALYISTIISAITIFLFIPVNKYFGVVFATICFVIFQSGILPLMDSLCYKVSHKYNNIKYGKIRLMGSAGYAFSSFLLGIIISRTSINIAFCLYSIFTLLIIILLSKVNISDEIHEKKKSKVQPLKILKNTNILLFLLSVTIISISYGANSSYVGVLLQEVGGNVQNLGLLWFVVAIAEIPVFFLINRLITKIGALNTYLLSLALFAIRFFLCTLWKNTSIIIIIQFLQGFTFPLLMAGGLDYLCSLVPAEARSFSISLMSALIFGLGSLIGNIGGGIIIDSFSVFSLYQMMSVISLISLSVALVLKKKRGSQTSSL
ncbi:MAG: MFS transporter [Lutispora sp.]|nr:MFS transporter [Lutispora sp.]